MVGSLRAAFLKLFIEPFGVSANQKDVPQFLLLFPLVFSLIIPASAEPLSLIVSDANPEPHYSEKVVLSAGDIVEVIYNSNINLAMEIRMGEVLVDETS